MLEIMDGNSKRQIVYNLSGGEMTNSELLHLIDGISESQLSKELKELRQSRVIERLSYGPVPPRICYKLTPLGEEIHTMLLDTSLWKVMDQVNIEE